MKVASAIKKLEKAGYKIEGDGFRFRATKEGNWNGIDFMKNGRDDSVTCIKIRHESDKDIVEIDYCAGQWCETITQAIKRAS